MCPNYGCFITFRGEPKSTYGNALQSERILSKPHDWQCAMWDLILDDLTFKIYLFPLIKMIPFYICLVPNLYPPPLHQNLPWPRKSPFYEDQGWTSSASDIGTSLFLWKMKMHHVMRKPALCHMRTTKMQISAVWSASLLFTFQIVQDQWLLYMRVKDSF